MKNAVSKKLIFLVMASVLSLGQLISDLYLSSLPAIAETFHSSTNAAQFSLSIYMIGYAISQLIYGPLSDGFGRRILLIIGLSLCLLGSVLSLTSQNIESLIVGRLLQGLGAGATLTLSAATLRDIFEGEELAKYSSYTALIGLAFLITAPLIGSYLQYYFGWRINFLLIVIFNVIALFAIIFLVPETNKHKHSENLRFAVIKKNLQTLFLSPVFIGYSGASLLAYGAILAWLTSGPIVLQTIVGLNPVEYGWAYALTGMMFAAGAIFNSKYVTKLGINKLLSVGLFCILLSGLTMFAFYLLGYINAPVIVLPAMLLLFGSSLVFPNSSAGVFTPFPKIAGIASAVFYSTRIAGGAIFSSFLALLPNQNQLPMALALIISALLAIVIFKLTIKK